MEPDEDVYKPPKLKMKLKETAVEKEEKRWRKEQKRLRKESKRIYVANGVSPTAGLAVTPPRQHTEESISPPRKRRRLSDEPLAAHNPTMEDWDESAWVPHPNAFKQAREVAAAAIEEEEFRQKMFDMMEDDEGPNAFVSGRYHEREPDPSVPKRWQGSSAGGDTPYDALNEEEYAESIRFGMWKRKNKDEAERLETLEKWKKEEAAKKVKQRHMKEEGEQRRIEILARERGKEEQRRLDKEMQDYRDKWEALKQSVHKPAPDAISPGLLPFAKPLRLVDLPWPIFRPIGSTTFSPEAIQPDPIRIFFAAVSKHSIKEAAPEKEQMRKVLREAILAYHPDRFVGRYLGSVRESDREAVRDAVVRCSQAINQLAGEIKE